MLSGFLRCPDKNKIKMASIRVVHTSDIHLGRRFPNLDREAELLRSGDIGRVFNELIDYVIKNKTHLLLISGGLFDKIHPTRETVSAALGAFGRIHDALPNTRIVLTPGQEELLLKKDSEPDCSLSIFNHLNYVRVIGAGAEPESVQLEFDGGKVQISSCQAAAFFDEEFKKRSIPAPKDKAGIFMLCAYSRRQDLMNITNDLLREKILNPLHERGYQYVALGHRHKLDLIDSGDFTAIFPGSLERFNFEEDRERKCFITFTIDDGKVSAPQTVRTSARPLEYINVTCSLDGKDIESGFSDIGRRGNKDKILFIVLNGQSTFDTFNNFQKSATLSKLRDRFAFVHIENRLVLVDETDEFRLEALRVGTPAEEFKRFVSREIIEAKERGEEVKLLEELYEAGVKEIEESL